jgi:hypothetical protein
MSSVLNLGLVLATKRQKRLRKILEFSGVGPDK